MSSRKVATMSQAVSGIEAVDQPAAVQANDARGAPSGSSSRYLVRIRRGLIWLLLACLVLRYAANWVDALAGASLPRIGNTGLTVIFAAFSILHAADMLGWRRALLFLGSCIAVSFCFEAVGVATGSVYGAYHYGDKLGAKIAGVPALIPFAWFMMIYASWIVAHVLLEGSAKPASLAGVLARSVIAAAVMTAWDVVMDPGQARAGTWVWEAGGAYFGVPFQNFVGWMATTLTIYLLVALMFRRIQSRERPAASRLFGGLPVIAYSLVALDHALISPFPELHVVAAFGICLIALLALLRLMLIQSPVELPG
jgi:uncharacterized membrane protein